MNRRPTCLCVLGPFDLSCGVPGPDAVSQTTVAYPALRRKGRLLLAYLAEVRQPVRRETLAALFFPDTDEPLGALRWHLSVIRRQVDPGILRIDGGKVQFDRAACWVDTDEFERLLDQRAQLSIAQATAAIALYRGEYLAGVSLPDAPEFEIWLLSRRVHYQQRYEQVLAFLVERLIQEARYADALPWALRLLQSNPLAEDSNLQLMRLYTLSGRRDAALRHYEQYRHMLRVVFQAEPDPAIMYHASLAGRLTIPAITD